MLVSVSLQAIRIINPSRKQIKVPTTNLKLKGCSILARRSLSADTKRKFEDRYNSETESKELAVNRTREILQKEFPDFFFKEKATQRISYVDFVDQALDKLKELGLEKDINAYKELLRVFPSGKYKLDPKWDIGHVYAPQQLCAVRVLHQLELNNIRVDKDFERIVLDRFGITSQVWLKVARMNFWSMKGRNVDQYPLPEILPEQPHEMAKVGLIRMNHDIETLVRVTNTSSLPNVIDKTWVVYSQSPTQQSIIEKLDKKTILYIEETGQIYVGDKYLAYFTLKLYDSEETVKRRKERANTKPDYNFNTLKMQFYGKPVLEKLEEMNDIHYAGDCHILAIGITGTSSNDSVLSWLKILQQRNPNLSNLSVVFRLRRPQQTTEVVETS